MPDKRKIILASASPRRKDLLRMLGLKFRVCASNYQEDLDLGLKPDKLSMLLSLEKAKTISREYENALIIAADTFIVFRNSLLGKPYDEQDALKMLNMLNGRSHIVITGYTVLDSFSGRHISRAVETKVWFRKISADEIQAYVKTGEPLDKAGAYAIQGLGSLIIKKIEGDYFNVIGLPVSDLAATLKKFGVSIL